MPSRPGAPAPNSEAGKAPAGRVRPHGNTKYTSERVTKAMAEALTIPDGRLARGMLASIGRKYELTRAEYAALAMRVLYHRRARAKPPSKGR